MDKHFKKEYEKKKETASKEYLNYIYALSLINGSHKEHLKIQRNSVKMFDDLHFIEGKEIEEKEMIKIISGKSFVAGFNWAFTHLNILTKLNSEEGISIPPNPKGIGYP